MTRRIDEFRAFVRAAPRFLFFTGKGGVGKTTLSCATAVALADSGRRVLLISTDPASNLNEVLGAELTSVPLRLESVPTLWALNIDPETAAREYRVPPNSQDWRHPMPRHDSACQACRATKHS